MIRLEIKNNTMTLPGEQQQISVLWSDEIDKYEIVTSERTLPSHQIRLIEQAKFTYASLGKVVEKQVETIKDQGEKPIKAFEDYGKQLVKSNSENNP